ncbi:hypothetical protein B0T10DRAFT_133638 [Thelonectria olida]|uniref:Secreted protein n=1 Tax=Thelonectria olida TaxID=1576542 RepID=A0A9P8W0E7_9HYPO|nr:hypothetical protein B0T10DRAFT_133638 [Thelonectria olida]
MFVWTAFVLDLFLLLLFLRRACWLACGDGQLVMIWAGSTQTRASKAWRVAGPDSLNHVVKCRGVLNGSHLAAPIRSSLLVVSSTLGCAVLVAVRRWCFSASQRPASHCASIIPPWPKTLYPIRPAFSLPLPNLTLHIPPFLSCLARLIRVLFFPIFLPPLLPSHPLPVCSFFLVASFRAAYPGPLESRKQEGKKKYFGGASSCSPTLHVSLVTETRLLPIPRLRRFFFSRLLPWTPAGPPNGLAYPSRLSLHNQLSPLPSSPPPPLLPLYIRKKRPSPAQAARHVETR